MAAPWARTKVGWWHWQREVAGLLQPLYPHMVICSHCGERSSSSERGGGAGRLGRAEGGWNPGLGSQKVLSMYLVQVQANMASILGVHS